MAIVDKQQEQESSSNPPKIDPPRAPANPDRSARFPISPSSPASVRLPVAFYASQPQYLQHLAPIYLAMDPDIRLKWFLCGEAARNHAQAWFPDGNWRIAQPPVDFPCVVAGFVDYQRIGGGRKVCMVEHGVGQTYLRADGQPDRMSSNPGGEDRHGVGLYICPSQRVADLNLATYPTSHALVAGSPWLDYLTGLARSRTDRPKKVSKLSTQSTQSLAQSKPDFERPTIAFSFRWENAQCPESRSGWPYFRHAVKRIVQRSPYRILVTSHPRMYPHIESQLQSTGAEVTPWFEDVVKHAHLLCLDNSSAGPEFAAATGRPLLWLNSSLYRREIEHGLRFWDWTMGQMSCDHPDELELAIDAALKDPEPAQRSRARMVDSCFDHRDGKAAIRSAEAIAEHLVTYKVLAPN